MQQIQNNVISISGDLSGSKETTYEIDDSMFIEFGDNNNELILDTAISTQAMMICQHFAKGNKLGNLRAVVYCNYFGNHRFTLSFQDEPSAKLALVHFKAYYEIEICSIDNYFYGDNSQVIIYMWGCDELTNN